MVPLDTQATDEEYTMLGQWKWGSLLEAEDRTFREHLCEDWERP